MTGATSPLQAIHQKELVLRRRLEEARRQADISRQAARSLASSTVSSSARSAGSWGSVRCGSTVAITSSMLAVGRVVQATTDRGIYP